MSVTPETVTKSHFLQTWIEENVIYFHRIYPHAPKSELREILSDVAEQYTNPPRSIIYNDYADDAKIAADLLTVTDWVHASKPICAGNGTFFKNQDFVTSPISKIIINRQQMRKFYQNERDKFIKTPTCYEYLYYEDMQKEAKVKINAIYGSFGAKTFQLFNILTAGAVTGTAQSLISATAIGFEAFLSNNAKFKSIDEAIYFFTNVVEKDNYDVDVHVMDMIFDKNKVCDHLMNTFFYPADQNDGNKSIIMRYLDTCTPEDLTKLYYKNNLYGFIRSSYIHQLMTRIFDAEVPFQDPNKVPEGLQDTLEELWLYCNDIVFYNHSYVERINRLVNDKRRSVILIDTDSNMINIQPWVDCIRSEVIPGSTSNMNEDGKLFVTVNTLAFLITKMVRSLLDHYCKACNILDREAWRINMKNEFFYEKMLLADVKKRYSARIKLREGKIFDPPYDDFKGHDFRKAGASEDIEAYFKGIISDCILGEQLDLVSILMRLSALTEDIKKSLAEGQRKYLTRANCKPELNYDDPESEAAVLAVYTWNSLYPENKVTVPDKFDMVFLNIPNAAVLDPYRKRYPKEVQRIEHDIFEGQYSAVFQKKGIHAIVLPNNGDPIPEFLRPFLDVNKVETRNISMFSPILTALSLPMQAGNAKYSYFTNVLDV
ncbi:MAG: hypothetical protein NC548_29665 [Lachnospiraceae bacterium]|nr:hypothetical protein [Lachnospiraceae bacterium]